METVIRIGEVMTVDKAERQVRVQFADVNIISGWLKVIKSPPFIPAKDVPSRTEKAAGGMGEEAFAEHYHDILIAPWLPSIGEKVLCVYNPGFNEDGYVLGAI